MEEMPVRRALWKDIKNISSTQCSTTQNIYGAQGDYETQSNFGI
jgi:hypothetical protein